MDNRPLGIVDSGLGGLSILKTIWSNLPLESTIYLADHQFFPYGEKTKQQLNRRLVCIVDFMVKRNVKAIVIACNTITTGSISLLRQLYRLPFIGTEPAIKPALIHRPKEDILVLATPATTDNIASKYPQVSFRACPDLAQNIEKYYLQPAKLKSLLKTLLKTIDKPYSALVLGCTHYLLILDLIKQQVKPGVMVIEPDQAIAKQVEKILTQQQLISRQSSPQKIFYTTCSSRHSSAVASTFLNQGIIFTKCSL